MSDERMKLSLKDMPVFPRTDKTVRVAYPDPTGKLRRLLEETMKKQDSEYD